MVGCQRVIGLLVLLAPALSGCVPWASRYVRVEADNARYFGADCRGSMGELKLAYFPFNDIFISALVDDRADEINIGIHVPRGVTAQLMQRTLTLRPRDAARPAMSLPLEPASYIRYTSFNMPWQFRAVDPFDREDFFGVLVGATRTFEPRYSNSPEMQKLGAKWYRFTVPIDVRRLDNGVIELPPMKINGVEFKGPTIRYENALSIYAQPINC